MISSIFQNISQAVTGMVGALGNGITEATKLIYDSTTSTITTFGVLCLVVVGVGVSYWGFRLVRGLIHLRG